MEFKAKDIAALLSGVVDGDPEISVNNVSKIEEGKPGTLAFLANPKYEHYIYTTQASIVLVNKTFEPTHEYSCTLIRVESAYGTYIIKDALPYLFPEGKVSFARRNCSQPLLG